MPYFCLYVCLEGAEEVAEEGVLASEREHLPLDHGALDVVVLQDHVLLQALDGVERAVVVGGRGGRGGAELGKDDLKAKMYPYLAEL